MLKIITTKEEDINFVPIRFRCFFYGFAALFSFSKMPSWNHGNLDYRIPLINEILALNGLSEVSWLFHSALYTGITNYSPLPSKRNDHKFQISPFLLNPDYLPRSDDWRFKRHLDITGAKVKYQRIVATLKAQNTAANYLWPKGVRCTLLHTAPIWEEALAWESKRRVCSEFVIAGWCQLWQMRYDVFTRKGCEWEKEMNLLEKVTEYRIEDYLT